MNNPKLKPPTRRGAPPPQRPSALQPKVAAASQRFNSQTQARPSAQSQAHVRTQTPQPAHVRTPAPPAACRPQPQLLQTRTQNAAQQTRGAIKPPVRPAAPAVFRQEQKRNAGPSAAGASLQRMASPHAPSQGRPGVNTPLKPGGVPRPPARPQPHLRQPAAPAVQPKPNVHLRTAAPPPPQRRLPLAPPARPANVVQAKYDVLITTELPDDQSNLVIESVTITGRPSYPDTILGSYEKGSEQGHTVAWDVLKLHHQNKYKGKTVGEAAADLNSKTKRKVIGREVEPTVNSVRLALKDWVEHKHKQEPIYWDSTGENKGRGGFFGGVKKEYESLRSEEKRKSLKKEKLDEESENRKWLYQKLMVLSALDFQEEEKDSKKLPTKVRKQREEVREERRGRVTRKLSRVYDDQSFDEVKLKRWSGNVDDLRKYKEEKKKTIKRKIEEDSKSKDKDKKKRKKK
jgi:hypothetical protein